MHHLILVREIDSQSPLASERPWDRSAGVWDGSRAADPVRSERVRRMSEIYRAVRDRLGSEVRITLLDPRNFLSFFALLVRDGIRYGVPATTLGRAMLANRASAAILDGQVLFEGPAPDAEAVVDLIVGRLVVHRA